AEQLLIAPVGKVLGRNSCVPRVPFMPRYVATIWSAQGRSRCTLSCQFCAYPMRKCGSIANVFAVLGGDTMKPFSSVSSFAALFCTRKVLESGGCCDISRAMF